MAHSRKYVIVSPAKDEEARIGTTIRAVIRQTVRPVKWIIVDDGSSDNTASIIESYAEQYPWLGVLRVRRDSRRDLGNAEIRAFTAGYELARRTAHDYVVKLDCDIDLDADYFERLLLEFEKDPNLGIAAGSCLELTDGEWKPMRLPKYHASGGSKMVRTQCFEQIGGFVLYRGWDTIDEIKAQSLGWRTRHFEEFGFYHLRKEGSAMGQISTAILHGEAYYRSGGGVLFFTLKVLHRTITGEPFLIGGLLLLCGFIKAAFLPIPRLLKPNERTFYRRLLNSRVKRMLLHGFRYPHEGDESPSA